MTIVIIKVLKQEQKKSFGMLNVYKGYREGEREYLLGINKVIYVKIFLVYFLIPRVKV